MRRKCDAGVRAASLPAAHECQLRIYAPHSRRSHSRRVRSAPVALAMRGTRVSSGPPARRTACARASHPELQRAVQHARMIHEVGVPSSRALSNTAMRTPAPITNALPSLCARAPGTTRTRSRAHARTHARVPMRRESSTRAPTGRTTWRARAASRAALPGRTECQYSDEMSQVIRRRKMVC